MDARGEIGDDMLLCNVDGLPYPGPGAVVIHQGT